MSKVYFLGNKLIQKYSCSVGQGFAILFVLASIRRDPLVIRDRNIVVIIFLFSLAAPAAGIAQRTVGETNWKWWSSNFEESSSYAEELATTGFDDITFSLTHLDQSGSWDFSDGEGASFSTGPIGRLDLISEEWIQNRIRQMDIAHEAGLRVNIVPVWIGKRIDEITESGDPSSIMRSYCQRLAKAGMWTHPALRWVVFGGDYYLGRRASEASFSDAWRACRESIPAEIPIGYHNGVLDSAIETYKTAGVMNFIFLQTGHTNEWPEYDMQRLRELDIPFEWGESVYPGIDIVNNDGSECASFERLERSFENGLKQLDLFTHFQYGHNDRHQNSDGDGGRKETWHCKSGLSAVESVQKHREFEIRLIQRFKEFAPSP